jgi:hypothetical protein
MKGTSFFLTVLLILAAMGSNAQTKKYKGVYNNSTDDEAYQSPFAFKIGYNMSDVLVSPEPMGLVSGKNGFHAGIVANNIKLTKNIGLQPELLYSLQGFSVGGLGKVGLHYISLPVLAKLDMGQNIAVVLGPQVSYLANARIGLGTDLLSLSYDGLFQKWDASLVGGVEYKIMKNASLGARYIYGVNNINKDFDIGSSSLNQYFTMKNSTVQVSLTMRL